jgi:hypothetical protein
MNSLLGIAIITNLLTKFSVNQAEIADLTPLEKADAVMYSALRKVVRVCQEKLSRNGSKRLSTKSCCGLHERVKNPLTGIFDHCVLNVRFLNR